MTNVFDMKPINAAEYWEAQADMWHSNYGELHAEFERLRAENEKLRAENSEFNLRLYSLLSLLPPETTCEQVQEARAKLAAAAALKGVSDDKRGD